MFKLKTIPLNLNYFEFGNLYASIRSDAWDKMPRSLWLKLNIFATRVYLVHPTLNKRAKRDIEKWQKELKKDFQPTQATKK